MAFCCHRRPTQNFLRSTADLSTHNSGAEQRRQTTAGSGRRRASGFSLWPNFSPLCRPSACRVRSRRSLTSSRHSAAVCCPLPGSWHTRTRVRATAPIASVGNFCVSKLRVSGGCKRRVRASIGELAALFFAQNTAYRQKFYESSIFEKSNSSSSSSTIMPTAAGSSSSSSVFRAQT